MCKIIWWSHQVKSILIKDENKKRSNQVVKQVVGNGSKSSNPQVVFNGVENSMNSITYKPASSTTPKQDQSRESIVNYFGKTTKNVQTIFGNSNTNTIKTTKGTTPSFEVNKQSGAYQATKAFNTNYKRTGNYSIYFNRMWWAIFGWIIKNRGGNRERQEWRSSKEERKSISRFRFL